MPFKGDMRLGGPHDNERTLNGTSSDLEGGSEFPPQGTVLSREDGIDYIYGSPVVPFEGVTYYGQTGDFVTYANGLGGEYTGWENLTYKPAGLFHTDSFLTLDPSGPQQEVPTSSGTYYTYTGYKFGHYWDGVGGYYPEVIAETIGTPLPSGTPTGANGYDNTVEFPPDSGEQIGNGTSVSYVWDGLGGYTTITVGSVYPAGTLLMNVYYQVQVPQEEGASTYANGKYSRWVWNGTGGYTEQPNQGSYHPYGTLIFFTQELALYVGDGTYATGRTMNYIWNGVGGYTNTYTGSYLAVGTFIASIPQQTEVTVDATPGLYFDNGKVYAYRHNGSGGYTEVVEGNFFPDGTYITTGTSDNYFWDGFGGYYAQSI